ncbi:PKD domain-containing protein [Marisediminicola senii]|uniref:PKD domain-containing protein n=1 Tax=Marisediminicola senii TaxID=2711233 RepID=UPI0013EBF462|nr:PKD domain-containing protein [Marisediminicola senii]
MGSTQPHSRPALSILTIAVMLMSLVVATTGSTAAVADTSPQGGAPQTVSSDPLPTVQIDGVVWDQVIVGNTVYVGGKFTTARPAGAAAGVNTVPRSNLLAYDIRTGELITSFAHTVNGEIKSVATSPDGTRVYIGGVFTQVNGINRYRVAAFDVATGKLVTSFAPTANGAVESVVATNSTVYIGGNFTTLANSTRVRAGAVSASTGALQPFAPVAEGGRVSSMVISPDETKVVLGGSFTTLNGSSNPGFGLGAVAATTGASMPWNINSSVRNAGTSASIYSLDSDGDSVYGTGYHFGGTGTLEGAFRADWKNGDLVWIEDCHGDTYSVAATSDVVYTASHAHYCGNSGGFPETNPKIYQRAMAWSKNGSGGVNTDDPYNYPDVPGTPTPSLLNWWPDINTGTFTGMSQGAWDVTANEDYVLYAGEFTKVNSTNQQGIVRFASPEIAPKKDGPRLGGASFKPSATSIATGTVQLSWLANYDRDNQYLTYDVIRDGVNASPVHTVVGSSRIWWDRPTMSFLDEGLAPGSTHTYRLRATDPNGNVAWGDPITATASGTAVMSDYARGVLDDSPAAYWRLGEGSGTAVRNWVGSGDAVAGSAVRRGAVGAIAGDTDTATTFSGSSSGVTGVVASQTATQADDTLGIEAWFTTTSTGGGKIVGFGNSRTGDSGSHDRSIYMDGAGRVMFGAYPTVARTIQSAPGLNDGKWHQVVANLGPTGMQLFIDGKQVAQRTDTTTGQAYKGYWRIGGDSSWSGNKYFNGSIDEVAIYNEAVSARIVDRHFVLAGRTSTAPNVAPVSSFTASATDLTVTVNGTASTDSDGTIASHAWTFGDGNSATGATANHAYAAAGTYTVTLTVTDDDGATTASTRAVTVTAPVVPQPPATPAAIATDAFERTTASGLGSAQTGGAWSVAGGAANFSVGEGVAKLRSPSAGATLSSYLTAVSSTDTDVQVTTSLQQASTGGGTFVSLIGRRVGTEDYRTRAVIAANGQVNVQLQRNGTTTNAAVVSGLTYATGDKLQIRMQVVGTAPTTIRAKVWKTGTTEPAAWQLTTTDTTASLQAAGHIGVASYLSGSSTAIPLTTTFDNLTATRSAQ